MHYFFPFLVNSKPNDNYGSLYLRLGSILFGFGSLLYSGLEIAMFVELLFRHSEKTNKYDFDSTIGYFSLLRAVLQTIFVLVQMFFIFLNGRLNIHFSKAASRIGIMNLISTNICMWMDVLISEINYKITKNDKDTNSNHLWNNIAIYEDQKNYFSDLFSKCRSLLYFCTIIYNLISAGILLEMWTNLKNSSTYFKPILVKLHESNKKNDGCNVPKSHSIGLILGIIFTILVVISEISTLILWNYPNLRNFTLSLMISTELMIYIVLTIAVLIGFYQINSLGDRTLKMNLDIGLLALSQIGMLIYAGFIMVASYFQILEQSTNNKDEYELVKQILIFSTSFFNFAQSVLQTLLIMMIGNCKKLSENQNNMKMSGLPSVLMFLAISNFTIWMILIFEIIEYPEKIQIDYINGNLVWTIIQTSVFPLVIFYRFQSSVCFTEIWKRAYCTSKNQT